MKFIYSVAAALSVAALAGAIPAPNGNEQRDLASALGQLQQLGDSLLGNAGNNANANANGNGQQAAKGNVCCAHRTSYHWQPD